MPKSVNEDSRLISMRIHEELLHRIDALIPVFASSSTLAPSGHSNRSDVLRALIETGLASFEGDGNGEI